MIQRFPAAASGSVTGSTSNAAFPSSPAGVAYLQAAPTNVGNATIKGALGSDGLVLTANSHLTIGPIENLNQIFYQLGNSADSIKYLVIR